jgi:CPA2 family monovalent cation:H+ antiporter-2
MSPWVLLTDVVVLLAGGLFLGALLQRLGQSAIVGYILAGVLLGPHALHVVAREAEVRALADLGVALLLFSIGLEFSLPRLRTLGAVALGGGAMQVVGTTVLAGAAAMALGVPLAAAIACGAAVALSSTASVLRLLRDRTELDGPHGRASLGILLFQDIAVVPLVVLVTALGGQGGLGDVLGALGLKLALVVPFVAVGWVLFSRVVPWVLGREVIARARDLPILIAVVVGLGSALAADRIGLSPALGAFVAGVLLAETPFATQIRSDVAPPRTLLVALFFGGIGMLSDPGWMLENAALLSGIVVGLLVLKVAVVWAALRIMRRPSGTSLAAGLALAQVGEFSFLLVGAGGPDLLGPTAFRLLVSSIVLTLLATPFLVALAGRVAGRSQRAVATEELEPASGRAGAIIAGFGPAGRTAACALRDAGWVCTVLDLNPRLHELARTLGLEAHVGNATHAEVLEHLPLAEVGLFVVALPDPGEARQTVEQARRLLPWATIVARARYSRSRESLERAGADLVVDEEVEVGEALAARLREREDASG